MSTLGNKVMSCAGWQFVVGMVFKHRDFSWTLVAIDANDDKVWCGVSKQGEVLIVKQMPGQEPLHKYCANAIAEGLDLDAPANEGCLLSLVRSHLNNANIYVRPSLPLTVGDSEFTVCADNYRTITRGSSKAAALVAALNLNKKTDFWR